MAAISLTETPLRPLETIMYIIQLISHIPIWYGNQRIQQDLLFLLHYWMLQIKWLASVDLKLPWSKSPPVLSRMFPPQDPPEDRKPIYPSMTVDEFHFTVSLKIQFFIFRSPHSIYSHDDHQSRNGETMSNANSHLFKIRKMTPFQQKLYYFFERPRGIWARAFTFFSMAFIFLSAILVCVQSIPSVVPNEADFNYTL